MADATAVRRCRRCGEYRPLEDFYLVRKPRDIYRPCRYCQREYSIARIRRQTAYMQGIKLERGCADCGLKIDIPEVYDFDHRPGEVKVADVSKLRLGDMRNLIAEIAKCDVVCANCHRIRTAERNDSGRRFGSTHRSPDPAPEAPDDEPPMLFDMPA